MSTNARGHLSSETLDLLSLAALDAAQASSAQAHLEACSVCHSRWREVNEDKQRFEQFVFARTLPKVEAAVGRRESKWAGVNLRWLMPALGLVTVAVAAFVVHAALSNSPADDAPYLGVKGGQPLFEVFALREEGHPFAVKPGQTLHPKDRIRFVVNPAGAKYVLVASRDAKGVFTVYHPFGALASEAVPPGEVARKIELSSTVELDETAGPERVVAVFSDVPVNARDVEGALAANPGAPSVSNARVVSVEFVKEAN